MTFSDALMTAARRYCMEHITYWTNRYQQERTGEDFPEYTYTDNDYNLFPRYNILQAILGEIELLTGQNDVSRDTLAEIGRTAQLPFSAEIEHPVEAAAIAEERAKFIDFIHHITTEALAQTPPLPYRRRLNEEDKQAVDQQLLERWNYDGNYWDPVDPKCPTGVIYLHTTHLTANDYAALTHFISAYAAPYVLEITEEGIITAIPSGDFRPEKEECAYCDEDYNWVIYCSHESTITFAGEQLQAFIRELFAGRENLLLE
ncbi:MAG: hypothetical protein J7623_28970 [Chitinophaga sp.]|uniref:hypothetical protein n=1 Tax=Chitinophaga sp. TaxID=1869181 RepID=UPI001B1E3C72|nr:hypothetical protein [Chitinophaga sp.]MBO9732711.1 hypothetical protein [Chitinophaga sp.]